MRNKDEEMLESSLIPGIRQQEGQLQDELRLVQEEAQQLLDQAQQGAQESLESVGQGFSASVDRLRKAGLETLKTSLEAEDLDAQKSTEQYEASVSARVPAAVQQILTMVLPEGRA